MMTAVAGWRTLQFGITYGSGYYGVAAFAIIFGTLWAGYALISWSIRLQDLAAGTLAVWTLILIAASRITTPAASYLSTWPLLFATIAFGFRPDASYKPATIRTEILVLVGLIPGTVMLAMNFATTLYGPSSAVTAAFLFRVPFIPYIDFISPRRWIVPAVLGVLAIAMISSKAALPAISTRLSRIPTASFIFRTPIAPCAMGQPGYRANFHLAIFPASRARRMAAEARRACDPRDAGRQPREHLARLRIFESRQND